MKRLLSVLLALLLVVSLAACKDPADPTQPPAVSTDDVSPDTVLETTAPETTEPDVFTLPEGITLANIDLAGMTVQKAAAAVQEAISGYVLTLQTGENTVKISAADMDLTLDTEALNSYLASQEAAPGTPPAKLASCDTSKVISAVENSLERALQNATIEYNSRQKKFVVSAQKKGYQVDASGIEAAVEEAVGVLAASAQIRVRTTAVTPSVTSDDPRIPAALEEANSFLAISLSYTYETTGVKKTTVTIPTDTLAGFLTVDKDFQVSINDESIRSYVAKMSKKYKGSATRGKFITSYGSQVNHTVQYYGASIDTEAMFADLKDCFTNHISDTRIAPYQDAITDKPYGGNYVEISLTDQQLWVYKDGDCVVSTPLVSGNVSRGAYTPTGVYSIYSKSRDVYLVGRTFRDFVHYWIPFNRNIGMHDAMWRSEFGDEIYRYNGSHGCVNLPLSAAGIVYENVSVGTMVIVYGGTRSAGSFTQTFSGTTQYTLADDAAPFILDVKPQYKGTVISYSSDNPDVASISESGVVTINGIGTAKITVSSAAVGSMRAASFTVEVTVYSACDDGRHTVSQWNAPSPACQKGVQTGTCDRCGQPQEKPHMPVDHNFTADNSHCRYGCGAQNPDYTPPVVTEPETTAPEQPGE